MFVNKKIESFTGDETLALQINNGIDVTTSIAGLFAPVAALNSLGNPIRPLFGVKLAGDTVPAVIQANRYLLGVGAFSDATTILTTLPLMFSESPK